MASRMLGSGVCITPTLQYSITPLLRQLLQLSMTTRGKIVLTIILLAVVGFGVYRWWDKIAPAGRSQQVSINPQDLKKTLDAKPSAAQATADVTSKLLAGDKAVSLVDGSAIPPVTGVSDYDKPMKDGKLVVQFPINIWP